VAGSVPDDSLPDRWFSVDRPVLRAMVEAATVTGQHPHQAAGEEIARLGLDRNELGASLRRLKSDRYITAERKRDDPGDRFIIASGVTAKALRMFGVYPSAETELERLRAIIEEEIERAPEEEKGKLIALRDALRDMGERVAVGVLSKLLERYL
jgi:transcription initiation factor IIE alpha subunit